MLVWECYSARRTELVNTMSIAANSIYSLIQCSFRISFYPRVPSQRHHESSVRVYMLAREDIHQPSRSVILMKSWACEHYELGDVNENEGLRAPILRSETPLCKEASRHRAKAFKTGQ